MKRVVLLLLLSTLIPNLFAQEFDSIVDSRDGQVYKTVKIGNQWWMAENLRATIYSDGTPLINGTGVGNIQGDYTNKYYFWYNDDSASFADTYGTLWDH